MLLYRGNETLSPSPSTDRRRSRQRQNSWKAPNSITLRLATVFGASPRMRLDLLVNHFVYAAVTDGYIVIFEKDFKRNYIHIRDVADCFVHCMTLRRPDGGTPVQCRLDAANLTKEELALSDQGACPSILYIHFSNVGSDPDKRNYIVSNQRLREAGFASPSLIGRRGSRS